MAAPSEETTERDINAGHVGALLQASRQRLGEDLPDVALMLRIRLPYLAAIEGGRYRELPGATYAVGFIRAYAEHLGLDSDEVVRRFKAETIDGGTDQKLSFPTPVPETGIPGGAYVFIGLVIAVLAYGAWYVSTTEDGFFAELISPLDEQLSNLLSDDDPTETPATEAEEGTTEISPSGEQGTLKDSTSSSVQQQSMEDVGEKTLPTNAAPSAEDTETPDAATEQSSGAASQAQTQTAAIQVKPDVMVAETGSDGGNNSPAETPEVPISAAAPVSSASLEQSAALSSVQEPVPTPTVDQSTAPVATPTPEPASADAPANPAPVQPEATVVEAPAVSETVETVATNAETAPVEAPPSVAVQITEPPVVEPPVEVAVEPLTSEPVETAAVADIVSETEPAPIVLSTGTESEIAAPEPPAVPTQTQTISEPDTSEIASNDTTSDTSTDSSASRITINAKNNSWIQVRDDVANLMLVTRLLAAGDSYEVPNRPGLVLLTGNAGALEIIVDGAAVPSIGGNGVVRRGVALEVERLKDGTAVTN